MFHYHDFLTLLHFFTFLILFYSLQGRTEGTSSVVFEVLIINCQIYFIDLFLFNCSKLNITQHFKRPINIVLTLWTNVEIKLIRRWKWNKIRHWIFNVAQRWYNVSETTPKQRFKTLAHLETTSHNVGATSKQRSFNPVSTLVNAILNLIGLVLIIDLETDE